MISGGCHNGTKSFMKFLAVYAREFRVCRGASRGRLDVGCELRGLAHSDRMWRMGQAGDRR